MKGFPSALLNIFIKTWVVPFFIRMAGFFFLVFYLMFGMVHSGELIYYHIALIIGCLTDFRFLVLVFLLWLLYYGRIYFFVRKSILKPENEFLRLLMPAINQQELNITVFSSVLIMMSPVWVYSLIMFGIGVQHKLWLPVGIILIYHIIMGTLLCRILTRVDSSGDKIQFRKNLRLALLFRINFPIPFLALNQLIINQRSMLILGKSSSLILLISSFWITNQYGFDLKVPTLFLILSLVVQNNLIREISRFDCMEMEFLRNLPISLFSIFFHKLILLFLFLLPELLVFILFPLHPIHLESPFLLTFLALGISLAFYSMVYVPKFYWDQNPAPLLILFLILFVLNLYSLWVWMILLTWAFSASIFFSLFYKFEWKTQVPNQEEES